MNFDHLGNVDEVIYSSFLVKSPGKSRSFLGKFGYKAKWRQRYFVLFKPKGSFTDLQLDYYDNEHCKRRYGTVDLEQTERIISSLDANQYKYVFAIKTKSKRKDRIYYLAADYEETMNQWVAYLCTACGLTPEPEFHGEDEELLSPTSTNPSSPLPVAINQTDTDTVASSSPTLPWTTGPRYTVDPTEKVVDKPYIPLDQCVSMASRQSLTSIPDEPPPPPPLNNDEQDFYDVPPSLRPRNNSDNGGAEQDFYDVPPQRNYDGDGESNNSINSKLVLPTRVSSGYSQDVYDVPPRRTVSLRGSNPSQITTVVMKGGSTIPIRNRSSSTNVRPTYDNLPTNSRLHPECRSSDSNQSSLLSSPPVSVFSSTEDASVYDFPKSHHMNNMILSKSPPPPPSTSMAQPDSHAYVNTDNCFQKDNGMNNNHLDFNFAADRRDNRDDMYQNIDDDFLYRYQNPDKRSHSPPATEVTTGPPPVPARKRDKNTDKMLAVGHWEDVYDVFPTKRTKSFKKDTFNSAVNLDPVCPTPIRNRTCSSKSSSSSSDDDREDCPDTYQVPPTPKPFPSGGKWINKDEIEYLDLYLQSPKDHLKCQQLSKSPSEYKEIDFVKTKALTETKNTREKTRNDSIVN